MKMNFTGRYVILVSPAIIQVQEHERREGKVNA